MAKSKFDFSKLKPVEENITGFDPSQLTPVEEETHQGFLKNLADYEAGLFPGIAHGLSDIGANVAQGLAYPFNKAYETYTGKEGYKVPRADINQFAPKSGAGQFGKSVGNFISPFIIPAASSEAFVTKAASPALRTAQTIVPGGIIGGLESEPGNSLFGTALGAAGNTIPMAMRGAQHAYNWMTRPSESLKQLKGFEKKLIDSLSGRQENLAKFEQEATKEASEILPEKHFVETAKNLSKEFGKNKKKVNEIVEHSYSEYQSGDVGQRKINNPYKLNELHNELSELSGVPKSTIREAKEISPKIEFSEILNDKGEPFKLEIPAKNSKLEDYVRFMRESRDAAGIAFKKAKSENLTQGEKERMLKLGKKLKNVSEDASNRISGTMNPEESKRFANINEFYGNVAAPLKYNPVLAKTSVSDTKLGEISDNLYKTLLQPKNEGVRNYLFGNKDFKKSLLEHLHEGKKNPLGGKDFDKKIDNIESLLKDKVKAGLMGSKEKENLKNIVNMATHQKSILQQMEKEKMNLGLTRKELESQQAIRKTIGAASLGISAGSEAIKYLLNKAFSTHRD